MLFNSYIFWVFFILVISCYVRLSHKNQNRLLLISSYIFYGYWDYRFLSLIMLSTFVDYIVSIKINESNKIQSRKILLAISLIVNLGVLAFFKYFNFFLNEFYLLTSSIGFQIPYPTLNIILPVGISFYTFQTLSYTIDVYKGVTKPTKNLFDFALYVSFFPQLVAGPIERSYRLLPQILQPRDSLRNNFSEGLYHVLFGLFKKSNNCR